MKIIKYITIIAIVLYAIFFALANKHQVVLYLFPSPYEIKTSLFLLVLITFILGFIIAKLGSIIERSKYHIQIKQLKYQLDSLEDKFNKYSEKINNSDNYEK